MLSGFLFIYFLTFCESVFLQANGVKELSPNQNEIPLVDDANETSSNQTDALQTNTTNGLSPNHTEIVPEAASETST